jgi:AP2 domain-containing protein/HNH endonuclease
MDLPQSATLPDGRHAVMKEIPLTQGKVAIVDDSDYAELMKYKWCAHRKKNAWYAVRAIYPGGKYRTVLMHQQLLGFPARDGLQVDHKNGDGLDNRRDNLRPATRAQQRRSFRTKSPLASSKYRGVTWDVRNNRWKAAIKFQYRSRNLGHFDFEETAARAYDAAAKELFGDFAQLNF